MTPEVEGIADELSKLAKLRDTGVLSEDEFAARKAKLLGISKPTSVPTVTTVDVTCQKCYGVTSVEGEAKQFVCAQCGEALRFVQCIKCKHLNHANEELDYWQCSVCNVSQASYWKYYLQIKCQCGATNTITRDQIFNCRGCKKQCRLCAGCGNYMRMGPVARKRWVCPTCETTNFPVKVR